jgi:hypothetical protein
MSLPLDHLTSKSFSQCQQDLCVAELFEGQGRFIDVGSRDPKLDSNSLLLEMMGWRGQCIEQLPFDYSNRSAEFIHGDALEILARDSFAGSVFDYASLDVDLNTTDTVKVMLDNGIRFLFATVEHDKYMHGCRFQSLQHRLLSAAGYVQMFIDIKPLGTGDMWFEDWWCDRNVCNRTLGVGLTSLEALAEIKKIPKTMLTKQ